MTENSQTGSKLASSVLVILVPILLLAVIGLLAGGMGLGLPELLLLTVVWVVGLLWVWRPRRN